MSCVTSLGIYLEFCSFFFSTLLGRKAQQLKPLWFSRPRLLPGNA
jgi:hypothetical protein